MRRREFLRAASALALAASARPAPADDRPGSARDLDRLREFRITKITGFRHVCPRPKLVGKNSHLDVHGDTTSEDVLRISTDQGLEGVGIGRAAPDVARQLIGQTLDSFWTPGVGATSPLGRSDHALYDLVGKALGVPSWKLFGGEGPEWVPVYDGSIYFADLLPQFSDRGVARIVQEVEQGLDRGHRAFKIKIGRGYKWMPRDDGFQRDLDVVRAIRSAVGPDVRLMVDANNGYTPDDALRWLDALGDDLFFVEEMFEENPRDDLRLKEHLKSRGKSTLVADGESAREVSHFDELLKAHAIDVLQPDIRAFGLTLQWAMSRRIAELNPDARLAPHNWGSNLALPMMLVLARGIPNFLMAEQDTSTSDLFDDPAWEFRDGKIRVPDLPGCGLSLREDVFRSTYAPKAWVVEA